MNTSKMRVKRSEMFCPRQTMAGYEEEWYRLNAGETVSLDADVVEGLGHALIVVGSAKKATTTENKNQEGFLNVRRKKSSKGKVSGEKVEDGE